MDGLYQTRIPFKPTCSYIIANVVSAFCEYVVGDDDVVVVDDDVVVDIVVVLSEDALSYASYDLISGHGT